MKIIGITGQTGAGKSAVCEILSAKYGYYHLDADVVARGAVANSGDVLGSLCDFFGNDILLSDGSLDRKKLGERAFSSKENTEKLDEIVYPAVTKEIENIINEKKETAPVGIIIDAIGLFESGADKLCDFTVAVTAAEETRLERIMKRDGLSEEAARNRIRAQKDEEFFKQHADLIIKNNQNADLGAQAQRITEYEKDE